MPQTSSRPQERDRLRKRVVSFAFLCAAGHILPSSDERAVCPAYGAGIAPAALLCAAGHILLSSDERAARPAYGAKIAPAALLCAAGHILLSSDERAARSAYGAKIAPAALLCAAGHILLPFGVRAACLHTGRKSPLRRRFTSERMARWGCRPLPVLRLPGGIKAASAPVHANSPQECRAHRKSFATTNNPSA